MVMVVAVENIFKITLQGSCKSFHFYLHPCRPRSPVFHPSASFFIPISTVDLNFRFFALQAVIPWRSNPPTWVNMRLLRKYWFFVISSVHLKIFLSFRVFTLYFSIPPMQSQLEGISVRSRFPLAPFNCLTSCRFHTWAQKVGEDSIRLFCFWGRLELGRVAGIE